ncbi:protein SCAR2-like [Abrus precatorius]|uniref:Protein SCAR n=1 Tax=Abrus precatorius TaxID=3816 RepID=A0A8B8L5V2_ABRPR|nr:protein SCAR2-like [Abrus precatorius]
MPICMYQIRNAHALADPELHRAADKDDSEALLEAVAMAGLVGFLRQLGDLAQFAAEMFHDLHEEVMSTAARSHSLISRVQQLEAEVPALEKVFLSQTHHSSYFTNGGIEWHPNLQSEQNLVTRGDLPRFIMDSYEECRGPPRLFLLDKFDVAGDGACLKRYTDPSFFKVESTSSRTTTVEVHREKRNRKVKPKKGAQLRNGETPQVVPSHSKLHQLLLEERIENACSDPARLLKLKKKQLNGSAVEGKTGRSYMAKILENPSPDLKMASETSIPLPVKLTSDDTSESGIKILEISSITPLKRSLEDENICSSPNEQEIELNPNSGRDRETNGYIVKVHEQISAGVTNEMSSNHLKVPDERELVFDEQKKREYNLDGYHSDDVTSDVDDYMDALATMDSELETDNERRPKKSFLSFRKITHSNGKGDHQLQAQFSDSQSFGDSSTSEEISSLEQDRNGDLNEVQAQSSDSQSSGTSCASDDHSSFRRDRSAGHTQLQAQFSDSQSIGNSTSEIEDVPFNQLSQTAELQKTYCGEFITCDDAHVLGEVISDSRPVSSGLCLMDSGDLLLSSDLGPTSLVSQPSGTQSDETSSSEYGNRSEIKVLQAESHNEYCSGILVSGDIGSNGVDPICPSWEVDMNSGTKRLLGGHNLKSSDDILATQFNSEDLFPVTETTMKRSLMKEPCSDFTHRNLQNEPELAEVKVLYPDQQSNFEEVPRILPGDEISESPRSLDLVEDDGHIKHPSSDITSSMTSFTKLEESLSIFADLHKKEIIVNKAVNRESLTELAAEKAVDQPEIVSADAQSNLNRSVPCDPSDSGIHNNIQNSLTEKIQYGSSINDVKMVAICSELDSQRSESVFVCQNNLLNIKDSLSPPSYNQLEPETDLQLLLKPEVSQQDAGFRNQENYTFEEFQPQQKQISNQWDQERTYQPMSEFAAETIPDKHSCDSSTKSSGQDINPTKCVMDPFKPLLPDLLHKATKVNLEEMPPMPPLPPMQWRTSKGQLASLFTHREDVVRQASFQPMQPTEPDVKSQFGLSTFEKSTLLSQYPFLPVMAEKSNMHQNSYGFSAGVSEQPVAISMQFPEMVNEPNGQDKCLVLDRSQIQNPILTSQDGPPLGYAVALEGILNSSSWQSIIPPSECAVSGIDPIFQHEKPTQSPSQLVENPGLESKIEGPGELHLVLPAECPVSGDDPISPKEKPILSPSQLMEEASLEVTTLKQSSINLERERGDPAASTVSPPSIQIVQPNHSLHFSEGEMVFSLDASAQTSDFDSEMPNGRPKNKVPLPQNPVIDPVAAFDKSRLRKVTERVMPQRAPKGDERDSLLEQIRTKSFNLRPAMVKQPPRIQGPKTNLKVAAILEKANSIRQALAGSDEDDDGDSWSDS